jgi:two-component system, chemotaxis family, sensor kinase CheA
MKKEDELNELFLAEAQENQQELDKLFTELEKDQGSKKAVEAIFRITHTLKANAAGMGYDDIASMAHTMEDVFSEIKQGQIAMTPELFADLFRANDMLGSMIQGIGKSGSPKVKFRGIKTKLEVLLKNARNGLDNAVTTKIAASPEPEERLVADVKVFEELRLPIESRAQPASRTDTDADTLVLEKEPEEKETGKIIFSDNIHIPVRKLDELMNLVGELMIEKDRVIAISADNGRKANDYARLQRITSELQYSVMDVRLVQVAVLFNKFHRIVRDVATVEGKQVNLVLEGTENEIDRNVLQIISDSLIHLVRNSVSHGIEKESDRVKARKPAIGTVRLSARSEKEEVIIEVSDDGKGIDPAIIRRKALEKGLITAREAQSISDEEVVLLIFESGFSSAETVTAISGRGVGMDVVKRSIDAIGGKIGVQSVVGEGTTISLTLPSSMAVKNALLFELEKGSFAIPLTYTDAVVCLQKSAIHKVGSGLVATHLKKNISIVFLQDLFKLESSRSLIQEGALLRQYHQTTEEEKLFVIVVSYNNREVGFVVDRLLQQKEIVEKPLGQFFDEVHFISGATILGTGDVCLVLDIPAIMGFLFKNYKFAK